VEPKERRTQTCEAQERCTLEEIACKRSRHLSHIEEGKLINATRKCKRAVLCRSILSLCVGRTQPFCVGSMLPYVGKLQPFVGLGDLVGRKNEKCSLL
jgi:hypothetical protein